MANDNSNGLEHRFTDEELKEEYKHLINNPAPEKISMWNGSPGHLPKDKERTDEEYATAAVAAVPQFMKIYNSSRTQGTNYKR